MSSEKDMFHPPVGMDIELQTNLHQKFVEDAFALLIHHQIHKFEHDPVDGTVSAHYRATDRFDIEQEDGQTVGVRLRFAEDPDEGEILACAQALDNLDIHTDVGGVTIIAFEHCAYDGSEELPKESEIEWQPYILIMFVSNAQNPTVVLNGETGEILTDLDLMQATSVLAALRDHLHAELLLEALIDQDMHQPKIDGDGRRSFNPGEFIDGNECPECKSDFTYCTHQSNVGSLN